MSSVLKVHTLAVELLSRIFLLSIPYAEDSSAQINPKEAPLNVSHVCRRWRYVALSTPRLWNNLFLNCTNNEATRDRALPTLRAFLERSKAAKFHFSLECCKAEDIDCSLIETMLHELGCHHGRISNVTIKADQSLQISLAVFLRQRALPALESLTLDLLQSKGRSVDCDTQFWTSIPNIRSLHLGYGEGLKFDFKGVIGCPKLQTLILDRTQIDGNDLLRILDGCPALETLYFGEMNNGANKLEPPDDTIRRAYPSITSLQIAHISGFGYSADTFFLTHAKLPNLRRFVFQSIEIPRTVFDDFLLVSKPPIEELELAARWDTNDHSLTSLLAKLPCLRRLKVPFRKSIARQLELSGENNECVCPLLEEITLGIKGTMSEDSVAAWTAVGDMIRSRWRHHSGRLCGAPRQDTTADLTTDPPARRLRKVVLPEMTEKQWRTRKRHQSIIKRQRKGLIVSFDDEDSLRTVNEIKYY